MRLPGFEVYGGNLGLEQAGPDGPAHDEHRRRKTLKAGDFVFFLPRRSPRRPGVLVRREELLDAVWPGVAVTPDTLTKSIGELRLALGDVARTPRFIETVHRRGFRFVATTTEGPAIELAPAETNEVRALVLGEFEAGAKSSLKPAMP